LEIAGKASNPVILRFALRCMMQRAKRRVFVFLSFVSGWTAKDEDTHQPVPIVVPFAAGNNTDLSARVLLKSRENILNSRCLL
jgi:tripartite-type tricarboxylate transporter receptor subunit TctC